jgi:hypothetical protein
MPAGGFFFRHVRNLELSHVEIAAMNPDPRPSFYLQDVSRVDLLAVTAPTSPKAFSLNKVTDLRAMFCRATPDVQLPSADGQTI